MRIFSLLFFLLLVTACTVNKESAGNHDLINKRIDQLESEISQLKLQIATYNGDSISDNEKDFLSRIILLEDKIGIADTRTFASTDVQTENITNGNQAKSIEDTEISQIQNDETAYENIRELYESGKYNLAIQKFQGFLTAYPESKYIPNAIYWMGESYYSLKDFNSAMGEFQKVVDYYPQTTKAPDSLLKIGKCYMEMGMNSQALVELKRIEKMYPDYERMDLVNSLISKLTE